ncbi:MAG: hypothetical protein WBA91_12740 [Paracoccaceae bacterium]
MFRKILLGFCLCALPFAAPAMTVQTIATDAAAWGLVDTTQTITLPSGATWTSAPLLIPNKQFAQVDPCVSFCSPFDNNIYGTNQTIPGTPPSGWQTLPFWATWQWPDGSNVNSLSFSTAQRSLSLLWGSVDVGNLIQLLLNGQVVGQVAGNGLGVQVGSPGRGAALVLIGGTAFDEVRFSSTLGGFEFTNIVTAPVPLPLPVLALAGALGMLGFAGRRKRA